MCIQLQACVVLNVKTGINRIQFILLTHHKSIVFLLFHIFQMYFQCFYRYVYFPYGYT